MPDFTKARTNMVDCQIHTAGVITPAVLNAFKTVPREKFAPSNFRNIAYTDENLPIGDGRFLLEPAIHARMIQEAEPGPQDVVLDIGGGTGYSPAIISSMVTTVIALEERQAHLDQAAKLWEELDLCNIAGVKGKLPKGCSEQAPYDLIFLNGAVAEIPPALLAQLSVGGRLIAIVKPMADAALGQVQLVRCLGEKQFSSYTLFEAGCPYLPGFEPVSKFRF